MHPDDVVVGPCIQGTGSLTLRGQRVIKRNGVSTTEARHVYVAHHGLSLADIKGQTVRHRCDNPGCVNPQHLLLGSAQDNSDDMVRRGRHRSGSVR